MISEKTRKIAAGFMLLVLGVASSVCSRRVYLDPPVRQIPAEEKNGIIYLDDQEQQQQKQPQKITQQNFEVVRVEYGIASYYADKFQGRPTASGELYDRNQLTAAHKTLPFGTLCRVTNIANKKSVIVRINDRGPFVTGRIIDLSYRAMRLLDGIGAGEIDVMVEVLR